MAVITLAQYKTLLGVTDTDATRDARIEALIPLIEADIVEICNNTFTIPEVAFSGDITPDETGGVYTFGCADGGMDDVDFAVGDQIYTSSFNRTSNNGRFAITVIADTAITVTEALTDEDEVSGASLTLVQWPSGVRMYAAQMISHLLLHMDDQGLTGESIKSYSYSREANVSGYPNAIVSGLKRGWGFVKVGRGRRVAHYIDKRGTFIGNEL